MVHVKCVLTFLVLVASLAHANPFLIDFPPKQNLTLQDYRWLSKKLANLQIEGEVVKRYPSLGNYHPLSVFLRRVCVGKYAKLLDDDQQLYPQVIYQKIGSGGDRCIVTYATYNKNYHRLAESILPALQQLGFNGYFYCRLGGYPNPTGKEARYAAIPYAFKVLMMREAYLLGCNHVLWIDSSMLPLKDPTPIFDLIEEKGYFTTHSFSLQKEAHKILPQALAVLQEHCGTDLTMDKKIYGVAFGLKMNTRESEAFIDHFYHMMDLGTPFFSCLPEEIVMSACLKKVLGEWQDPLPTVTIMGGKCSLKEILTTAREKDRYFLYREHKSENSQVLFLEDVVEAAK